MNEAPITIESRLSLQFSQPLKSSSTALIILIKDKMNQVLRRNRGYCLMFTMIYFAFHGQINIFNN